MFHYHSHIAFEKPKAIIVSDPLHVISSCLYYVLFVLNVVNFHNMLGAVGGWGVIFIHFMAPSGFFQCEKLSPLFSVLCFWDSQYLDVGPLFCFPISIFHFFVLLFCFFGNVPQLYFLILFLANESIFLGNRIIIFVCSTTKKKRAHLLSKSFRSSIKGKWGQTLQRAVVAVRPGEVIICAVCGKGYCVLLGLLNSQLYSVVFCSRELL